MVIKVLSIAAYVNKFYPNAPKKHWYGIEYLDEQWQIFAHPDGNQGASGNRVYLGVLPDNLRCCWVNRIHFTTAKVADTQAIYLECGAYVGDPEAIQEIEDFQEMIRSELNRAVLKMKELLQG